MIGSGSIIGRTLKDIFGLPMNADNFFIFDQDSSVFRGGHAFFGKLPVDDLSLKRTDAGANLLSTHFAAAASRKPGKKVKK